MALLKRHTKSQKNNYRYVEIFLIWKESGEMNTGALFGPHQESSAFTLFYKPLEKSHTPPHGHAQPH